MKRNEIGNRYFEWLLELVDGENYRDLLIELLHTPFRYSIPNDKNREEDGVDLRYRFVMEENCSNLLSCLDGPCSVLEMMVALSIRCEEDIMDDPDAENRTTKWFWGMIENLGLGDMTDAYFDGDYVHERVDIFLNRDYEPNGEGGLFTVRTSPYDLRTVEIWYQMCWYLDEYLTGA